MGGVAGPYQPEQLKQRAVPVMASQSEKVCPSCRHCVAGSATTWRMEKEDCQIDTHQRRWMQQLDFNGHRGIQRAAT